VEGEPEGQAEAKEGVGLYLCNLVDLLFDIYIEGCLISYHSISYTRYLHIT
jgi:hypothetical protein